MSARRRPPDDRDTLIKRQQEEIARLQRRVDARRARARATERPNERLQDQIEQGKRGHYLYCQSKCLAEYMACEAANAAEAMTEACVANPVACAAIIAGAVVIIVQPELAPVLIPVAGRTLR